MPEQGSAAKRHRQNETHRIKNRSARSAVRTEIKKYTEAIRVKDKDSAEKELAQIVKMLDTAAGKKIYHKNTIARKKSRLHRMLSTID